MLPGINAAKGFSSSRVSCLPASFPGQTYLLLDRNQKAQERLAAGACLFLQALIFYGVVSVHMVSFIG